MTYIASLYCTQVTSYFSYSISSSRLSLCYMLTLVLKPANLQDFQLLLALAHRLGVEVSPVSAPDTAQVEARFFALAGRWQSEETGEELNAQLQAARSTSGSN